MVDRVLERSQVDCLDEVLLHGCLLQSQLHDLIRVSLQEITEMRVVGNLADRVKRVLLE